jgi:hypothetical protein
LNGKEYILDLICSDALQKMDLGTIRPKAVKIKQDTPSFPDSKSPYPLILIGE